MTPLVLRRPRGDSPAPLPRSRSARGTERGPRPSELDITAVRPFDDVAARTLENTLETPMVAFDDVPLLTLDDDDFLEDGH